MLETTYLRWWLGWKSGSQNCEKTSKTYRFLEIVQYMCNTTFLYQNSMENPKKKKQYKNMQISKYFSGCKIFFLWSCLNLISVHKNLPNKRSFFFKFKPTLFGFQHQIFRYILNWLGTTGVKVNPFSYI